MSRGWTRALGEMLDDDTARARRGARAGPRRRLHLGATPPPALATPTPPRSPREGSAADARRHRRPGARRPADRRRPLPRRAAARVAGHGRRPRLTSSCCTATVRRRFRRRSGRSAWCRARAARAGSSGSSPGRWAAIGPTCSSPPATPRRWPVRRRWRSPCTTCRSSRTPSGSPPARGCGGGRSRPGRPGGRHVVLAPSAFSAREIVRFTGVPESRGAHRLPRGPAGGARAPGAPRPRPSSIVGSLFQRRRLDVLIAAFADVAQAHPDAHLDIVGENRTVPRVDYAAQVAALGLGARVQRAALGGRRRRWPRCTRRRRRLRSCPSTRASASPRSRRWRTAPSPVVLDTPVAREIYGEAAVRVADGPTLVDDLAAALGRLLTDPAARAPYLAAAPAVLASYRWADTAARTLARPGRGRRCLSRRRSTRLAIVIVTYNVRADLERCLREPGRAPAVARPPRSWSSTTPRPTARSTPCARGWPGVQAIDAGANLGFARANNLGIRATVERAGAAAQPRHARRPTAQIDCLVAALTADAGGRGRRPAARRRRRARRALLRSADLALGRVRRSDASGAPTTAREPWAVRAGRAAHPRARRAGLGQRRVPAGLARRPRGRRAARRALFHVHGRRRPVRRLRGPRPPGASSCRRRRSATCADARPPPRRPAPSSAGARASWRSTASTTRRGRRCWPGGCGAAASMSDNRR